jgi:hypothetical protein
MNLLTTCEEQINDLGLNSISWDHVQKKIHLFGMYIANQ